MVSIWKRLALTGTIVVAAVGTVGVAPASARGFATPGASPIPCQTRALSKAFSQWGDQNDYFTVTDGTFEAGAASWSLLGAIVRPDPSVPLNAGVNDVKVTKPHVKTGEQAPWKVNGANHNSAMVLPEFSRASAPQTCVVVGEEYFRFFYRAPASTSASMNVTVRASRAATSNRPQPSKLNTVTLQGTGTAGWFVSPPIAIPNMRQASPFEQTQMVNISFQAITGEWAIDDVMIDPFKVR